MRHYSCDLCGKDLDPENSACYQVRVDIAPVLDPPATAADDDRDYLQELNEVLSQQAEVPAGDLAERVPAELHFDLCPQCTRRFLKNPLGRRQSKQVNFSEN